MGGLRFGVAQVMIALALALALAAPAPAPAPAPFYVDPVTVQVTQDRRKPFASSTQHIDLAAQRGECERAQVWFWYDVADLYDVSITFTDLQATSGDATLPSDIWSFKQQGAGNALLEPLLCTLTINIPKSQDMLETNIGKVEKNRRFLQVMFRPTPAGCTPATMMSSLTVSTALAILASQAGTQTSSLTCRQGGSRLFRRA